MRDNTASSASVSSSKSVPTSNPQERLAQVIAETGLTQRDFARQIGIDETSLCRILKGARLTARVAVRIEAEFGKRALWLLTGAENHVGENSDLYSVRPTGIPIRETTYKCWRCMGVIQRAAQVCPHCAANFAWQESYRSKEGAASDRPGCGGDTTR